jgi:hypothetical protein
MVILQQNSALYFTMNIVTSKDFRWRKVSTPIFAPPNIVIMPSQTPQQVSNINVVRV